MAEKGNAIAQVVLSKGGGVSPDTDQAAKWFIKIAE